jgi:hypothetical protein
VRVMVKLSIVLVMVLMSATPSSPQQRTSAYTQCISKAVSQASANECAVDESNRASVEHVAVLKQVLARTLYTGGDSPEQVNEKVRAMEKAWGAYRDAFVEARYPGDDKRANYGTRYGQIEAELYADLTRKHLDDLRVLMTPIAGR